MKSFGLPIGMIVIASGLVLSTGLKANAAGSAKDQITEIENKMIAATNAEDLMKYYDDRDVTLYDITPPLQFKGASAVHDDFANFFSNASNLKAEFVELVVVAEGNMGMARSIQHFTWKDKEGKTIEITFRETDVFHKVKGGWKAMHTHISVPVDLKTNQGQLNLKP